MKRCPQCEFVYEDEQAFCDMDGSKLAFDARQLPKLQALTHSSGGSTPKGFWRGRLITVTAGLVLATVLGLVYYVSTHRAARPQPIPASSQTVPVRLLEFTIEGDVVRGSDHDTGELTDGKYSRTVKFAATIIK